MDDPRPQQNFDWNDLVHFLAVARHKSTLAAARSLGLSQSTVQRRLMELERNIGHKLVRRDKAGLRTSPRRVSYS